MRITLDTNVLVSAFISRQGKPAHILEVILALNEITLVVSEVILAEVEEVLRRQEVVRRFHYSASDVSEFVEGLRKVSEVIEIRSKFSTIKDDPDDNLVLSTAYDGKAEYLVSGDRHITGLREFRGIKIVNPSQFTDISKGEFGS